MVVLSCARTESCEGGAIDRVLVTFVGGFFAKPVRRFPIPEGDGYVAGPEGSKGAELVAELGDGADPRKEPLRFRGTDSAT